jgi:hypothetical protein
MDSLEGESSKVYFLKLMFAQKHAKMMISLTTSQAIINAGFIDKKPRNAELGLGL